MIVGYIHGSQNYNDAYTFLNVGLADIEAEGKYTYAGASGGYGIYHTTIYRTIDLTNVKSIKFTGFYWCDKSGASVSNVYQSGLVKDNEVSANCEYDTNYYEARDLEQTNTRVTYDVQYNVSSLSGNHILAFTVTHPNCRQYSTCAGYKGEILLEP